VAGVALALDVDVRGYQQAAAGGRLGTIAGRAWEERRRPDGRDVPLAGTSVVVFPPSPALLERLEGLKRHARDSATTYRLAATEIRKARERHEQLLWQAGAADLVRATAVDAEGRFTFDAVPEGPWMLVAWRATVIDTPSAPVSRRDRSTFVLRPRVHGYQAVSVWMRRFEVRAGGAIAVDLTDRNAWFSGVVEETTADAGR
jgi:hypothetical protein